MTLTPPPPLLNRAILRPRGWASKGHPGPPFPQDDSSSLSLIVWVCLRLGWVLES